MLWHEQSWTALRDCEKDIPVVVPLGSIEQHGHHLPVSVDTVQVQAIADRAEQALDSSALFLPTLWLGCSHHHLDFAGTISLPPSLYSQVIKSTVACILSHGFERIFLLNGHGGNQVPMSQALTELITEDARADRALLAAASWWQVGKAAIDQQKQAMTTPFISHACEYETSMMLALRPELVQQFKAVESSPAVDNAWWHSEYGGRVSVFKKFHRVTAAGSMGHPTAATAEKGASLLAAVTNEVVSFLRDFRSMPLTGIIGPK